MHVPLYVNMHKNTKHIHSRAAFFKAVEINAE